MTASELVTELQARDIHLSARGPDRLHINAPERLVTTALIESLMDQKTEIIAELRRRQEDARRREFFRELGRDPAAWHEFETQMEAHAASLEIEEGCRREEALTQAEVITYERWQN